MKLVLGMKEAIELRNLVVTVNSLEENACDLEGLTPADMVSNLKGEFEAIGGSLEMDLQGNIIVELPDEFMTSTCQFLASTAKVVGPIVIKITDIITKYKAKLEALGNYTTLYIKSVLRNEMTDKLIQKAIDMFGLKPCVDELTEAFESIDSEDIYDKMKSIKLSYRYKIDSLEADAFIKETNSKLEYYAHNFVKINPYELEKELSDLIEKIKYMYDHNTAVNENAIDDLEDMAFALLQCVHAQIC